VASGFGRHGMPSPASNPDLRSFDLETGVRVASSRIYLPNFGTLGLWILELFAMYPTDGQTDGRTKATFIARFPTVAA